jgi:8-oxo-dGTP pyrophosphatase MutT (NUDIX family)
MTGTTERQRTRVAAYALVTGEDRRFLLCRTAPGVVPDPVWVLPGGGIEFGESPQMAVVRELEEETGLAGDVRELLDVHDRIIERSETGERVHAIGIIYRVDVSGDELRDEVDGSTDTCAWVPPTDTANLNLSALARHALSLLDA